MDKKHRLSNNCFTGSTVPFGHAAVQEWQIVCANVRKDFTDKLTIKKT